MNKNKLIFYIFWISLLLFAAASVVINTPLSFILKNEITIVNTLQRLTGLWAFIMLSIQIILGAFMTRLTEKFGGWIFRFHIFQGIIVYLLIITHPLLFTVFNYVSGRGLDPFNTFIDICVLCDNKTEFAYNFGRLAFWLITAAVFAGYFRLSNVFLRVHWKKIHILNYIALGFIFIHSFQLGSDVLQIPFVLIYILGIATTIFTIFYKLYYNSIFKTKSR